MPAEAPRRLPALTALRFVAAALVVLVHSQGLFGVAVDAFAPFDFRQAVSFFFVLSGFILTHAYPELKGGAARGRFLWARFARLWPAHVAAVGLCWFLAVPQTPDGVAPRTGLALSLALVQSWWPVGGVYFSGNVPAWSISTEWAFYLFFLILIPAWGRTWPWKLALALGLNLAVLVGCRLAEIPVGGGRPDQFTAYGTLYVWPAARLFEFVLGMATAELWRRWQPRWQPGRMVGTATELAVLVLAVVAMYCARDLGLWLALHTWFGAYALYWFPTSVAVCGPFALLIGVLACERGALSRLLAWKPLVFLGEISYSLYLLHFGVVIWYGNHLEAFDALPGWLTYGVCWVVLLLAAHLCYAVVEKPLRELLTGGWRRAARALPPRRRLLVEALLLTALLAPVWGLVRAARSPRLSAETARTVAERGDPAARDVRFGDGLLLHSAELTRIQGSLRLRLVWECLHAPTQRLILIRLLAADGRTLTACHQPRAAAPGLAWRGLVWQEKTFISPFLLPGAVAATVEVRETEDPLPLARGATPLPGPLRLALPQ